MRIAVWCPVCKKNITICAKPMNGFVNVCELHICHTCYYKFRIVLDLLTCLGCAGQGALHICGSARKIYVGPNGEVLNCV